MPLERGWHFDPTSDPWAEPDFPPDPAPRRIEPEFSRPDLEALSLAQFLRAEAERLRREALARTPKPKPQPRKPQTCCSRAEYIDTQLFGRSEEEK
jgi:hypothetical protein